MKRTTISIMLVFLLLMSNAFADGMVISIHRDPYLLEIPSKLLRPTIVEESEQVAFISWKDGMEQMIIKIGIKAAVQENETYIWIFPVPAKPKDVVVYHIKYLHYNVKGKDLYKMTKGELKKNAEYIFTFSQIWPIPFMIVDLYSSPGYYQASLRSEKSLGWIGRYAEDYGVTVHERIEKHGLVSEIITAKEANGLKRYIRDKHGVELPKEIESVFSDYIGKEFTFVVSESQGKPKAMAVMVEFPTDVPYFPLKPTSIYGSSRIPIMVYIEGFWEPNKWREVEHRMVVKHGVEGNTPFIYGEEKFYGSFNKFTVVSLNTPSKYLKQDLYFKKSSTAEVVNFIREHLIVFSIIIILMLFSLSGIITWAILSRKWEELVKYVTAGVASIFTPIATLVVFKKAGISSKMNIEIPIFTNRRQNVVYYAIGIFFTMLVLALLGIPAIIIYRLMEMLHSIDVKEIVYIVAIIVYTIGGALFWAVVGAKLMRFISKKWQRIGSVAVPLQQILLIIVINAVLYALVRIWLLT